MLTRRCFAGPRKRVVAGPGGSIGTRRRRRRQTSCRGTASQRARGSAHTARNAISFNSPYKLAIQRRPYLVFLPINLPNRIAILFIHHIPNRHLVLHSTDFLRRHFQSAPSQTSLLPNVKKLTQCAAYFISSCVYRKHEWHTYSHCAVRPPIRSSG
jgi:hypothetical protein